MPPKRREGRDDDGSELDGAADSGASNCNMVKASSIKKGDCLLIKGNPCKCVSTSTAKTGKHGGAKCHIVGLDIFTQKKHECIVGSTVDVDSPIVVKRDLMLVTYDAQDCQITGFNDETQQEETFKVTNEDTLEALKSIDIDSTPYNFTVMEAYGKSDVIAIKEDKN